MQVRPRRRGAACELASVCGAGPALIIARRQGAQEPFSMARAESAQRSRNVLGTALQLVALLLLLSMVALVVSGVFAVLTVTRAPGQVASGVTAQASQALSAAQQAIQNATDPIQRREGASSPQTAQYAMIHAELRQPRVTRVLGQVIRTDSDPHDYVVYTGEVFRIGKQVYRVNWISQDDSAMAAGIVRTPDTITQPFKFDYP